MQNFNYGFITPELIVFQWTVPLKAFIGLWITNPKVEIICFWKWAYYSDYYHLGHNLPCPGGNASLGLKADVVLEKPGEHVVKCKHWTTQCVLHASGLKYQWFWFNNKDTLLLWTIPLDIPIELIKSNDKTINEISEPGACCLFCAHTGRHLAGFEMVCMYRPPGICLKHYRISYV